MNNPGRWRIGALASAIALLGSLASLEAHALALGRITVQSALGEPLRAEIDVTDITAEEAASLRAGVAPADAFKAAGLEYTAAVTGLEVNLQRRADGRAFLRLSSSRPVTEPFVDLILQANWSTGRITRDYTMLFDPPNLRAAGSSAVAVAPTAPVLSRPAAPAPAASPAPARTIAALPPAVAAPPAAVRPAPVARAPAAARVQAKPAEKPAPRDKQLTVKAGDTASKIAAQNKPASVSLDQMLVALLKNNPEAFIGGNVNRIKAGAVLDMPTAAAASAASAGEATQTIIAQSKDFNDFRRNLARGVSTTQVAGADRQAGGSVQAKVEDRAPASATPDKLTLSKGSVQGKAAAPASAAEDKIAKERQAREASTRMAELSKNISDLNKLTAPAVPATAAPGSPAVTAAPVAAATKIAGPAVTAPPSLSPPPAPAATPAATTAAASSAAAPVAASAVSPAAMPTASAATASLPTSTASAALTGASAAALSATAVAPAAAASAAAVKPPVVVVAAAQPAAEPGLLDDLLENPLLLPLGGGLLALLAGFGFYRYRQHKNASQIDSSFLESRLQPDSFFGASGGERIDTAENGTATGSSLVYSASQLDAAGDVDPVAEADVYLAYGRDLQAEEILKEAMRTSPTRVAVHSKLLEIYAKRRDSKAFEMVAIEAFNLTHGNGPDWTYIGEMGRDLDPENPMYQPGGHPPGRSKPMAGSANTGPDTMPLARAHGTSSAAMSAVDVDLDLDFSLDDAPYPAISAAAPVASPAATKPAPLQVTQPVVAVAPDQAFKGLDLDFASAPVAPSAASPASAPKPAQAPNDIEFESDDMNLAAASFVLSQPAPLVVVAAAPAPANDSGLLEFDMDSLSLDLNGPTTESPAHAMADASNDPLETKFQLAEEFRALGDPDGARSLAEEVLDNARGPLRVKAQAFLNALS
ncbi:FimV/HubP family polar landmark protein [Polaromonas sp.]|uniref:FimV/HubP family polar landmark protein n=1 Tax=Polaromonas sp. TaxID=1869339 RepID=UPI00286B6C25|nr:FimV/HubP family polar landmark protein [Polaromonas sp.]